MKALSRDPMSWNARPFEESQPATGDEAVASGIGEVARDSEIESSNGKIIPPRLSVHISAVSVAP
jgi:hypothetical protein